MLVFQSTRPMRGATALKAGKITPAQFQSTRPMRGATRACHLCGRMRRISIHAPHAGRDCRPQWAARKRAHFNPRAPCGARLFLTPKGGNRRAHFNPRAPCGARRVSILGVKRRIPHFNPRAPCGARQQKYTKLLYTLLRQKAILRQFHAKRCLSKRFAACRSAKTSLFAVRTAAEISASFCFAL